MNDAEIKAGISDLRKFLKKVKPKYHFARGWEDMRWMMLDTLNELEYRSKYMDDKMIRFKESKKEQRKINDNTQQPNNNGKQSR